MQQWNPPVVLIVANHQDSLAMYAFGLLAMGFQPLTASTADDAFARACQFHPEVIVADLMLAGASGLELTRRLRGDARTKDTGIIILTGHAGASATQQATNAGCDRLILKPCLPDSLAREVRDVLLGRQRASHAVVAKIASRDR